MKKQIRGLGLAGGLVFASSPVLAQQDKTQTIAQADQKIAGEVQSRSNGTLNLQPYGGGSAFSVQLPDNTPVYQGGGVIKTKALVRGVNVRVHYDQTAGAAPKAVAVEVLTPKEAQAAKQQPQQAPAPQQQAAKQETATPEPQTSGMAAPSAQLPADVKTRISQADGEQAGKLQQASGDTISYDPYQKAAGDATLALPTDIVVFRGAEKLNRDALKPGADARVYYEIADDGAPRAVAVQLLTPEEASQISKAYVDAPKPATAALPSDLPSDLREKVSSADGHQPGQVQEVTSDRLTLDPFNESAGVASLSLPSDAAFFRGSQKVERSEVTAGDDVRVFYENTQDGTPRIVAVQLLSSEEAKEAKSE